MADEITLQIDAMAHGGSAMGRDRRGRPVFVPFTIPGEKVRVRLEEDKGRYAHGELLDVLLPSPDRLPGPCPHFGICGGCHFQHMRYEAQLQVKRNVVADQLQRIGGLQDVQVRPVLPSPQQWAYSMDMSLSLTPQGQLGYWAPRERQVIPIETCLIVADPLLELFQDIDLQLPDLRKLTLRMGSDDALLAAFEVENVEPPDLEVDFPISVAIVLPDCTSASLIGDPYLVRTVKEREFRFSPGCFFQPNLGAAPLVVDTMLAFADLKPGEWVVEGYSGVGMLTAFLAEAADQVLTVEINSDAVADMSHNLEDFDNVALYEAYVEEVLPFVQERVNCLVVNPPAQGLSKDVLRSLVELQVDRLVYISSDVATLARDGKRLARDGYRLVKVQPIDTMPQTYHVECVALWVRK